ncbi:MAG: NifU family protein, partial [Acidimicrobiia bacterium]
PMTTRTENVIEITDTALEQITGLREQEPAGDLLLGLRISGVSGGGFVYETAFLRSADVGDTDHIENHGDLPVAIPSDSVENLQGAVLDLSVDPSQPGLVLRNPNSATPSIGGPAGSLELEGTTEEKVSQLLEQVINPAIAAHGGRADLVKVEGSAAMLQLGGGCQGCGLAAMTLRQGIESAILEHVPEITEVTDVTDHESGANPYYV